MPTIRSFVLMAVAFAAGAVASPFVRTDVAAQTSSKQMVYELRTYHTHPGKLVDLHTRFRDHTLKLFERHGMTNIGYWVPQDEPAHGNTLIYVIAHESREQAKKNWAAFLADPEWQKVRAASEVNGPLLTGLESVFMDPADYSKLK